MMDFFMRRARDMKRSISSFKMGVDGARAEPLGHPVGVVLEWTSPAASPLKARAREPSAAIACGLIRSAQTAKAARPVVAHGTVRLAARCRTERAPEAKDSLGVELRRHGGRPTVAPDRSACTGRRGSGDRGRSKQGGVSSSAILPSEAPARPEDRPDWAGVCLCKH